ncbi:rhodanese-like domain-containing protein [Aestuariispira insulae]|uniref:Rhodanese-related sulfurtransferase n=1 Tax=Aestuariispira insulae TaxID=1461337 RepID=A0A3D9HWU1_9PROT|nr:rhodanese family protein [Aestuariispira insulae]RED53885.1 rhodanese-related sulfurtransferase [Aestuariispira insulae]
MSQLSPEMAAPLLSSQECIFLDVREPDEFARSHIPGSLKAPLSQLTAQSLPDIQGRKVILLCQSGMRSEQARQFFLQHGVEANCIEGGLTAWQKAGLPVNENKAAPISIMRQVQIIAGSLTLAGVLLGSFVTPSFYWLSAAVGAGLAFAGLSGTCMMASLLSKLPYNKVKA